MATSNLERRAFLRTATAATAASAFAAPQIAANDRISTAFIGVGVMGSENLKAAMNQPGVAAPTPGSSRFQGPKTRAK